MRYSKFIYLSTYLLLIFLSSCKKDSVIAEDELKINNDVDVINNRFNFSNRNIFSVFINKLKDKSEEEVQLQFREYYLSGFRSHNGFISIDDHELLSMLSDDYIDKVERSVDFDEENPLIGDPD